MQCRPRAMFQKWKNSPTNWRVFFAFSHPNSWISSGWYKKRCSWDWKVIDRSYCHISCYLNGGIHSDVASFSLGVPLLVCMSMYVCTLRTIVNRLYTDVNHSSANPVAPPRFWHLTNTRIIGTDQLLLYYCITYTLKHYGWWSSGGLVVGVLGFQ